MEFSNLHNVYIAKNYRIIYYCDIDGDTYIVHMEKWEGEWGIHYVSHWIENCRYCSKVRLDSDCVTMTRKLRDHFGDVLIWLGEQKEMYPEMFGIG